LVSPQLKAEFAASGRVYGSRRLGAALQPERPQPGLGQRHHLHPHARGWLYLAVVLNLCARKVVGWAMAPSMHAQLVCAALQLAIAQRQRAPGLIVHSDRAASTPARCTRRCWRATAWSTCMSRKGNCWDNAVTERFFLNLKTERVWQRDDANHAEAMTDIADYIVGFYNSVRLHSKLGNNASEQQSAIKQPIVVSEKT